MSDLINSPSHYNQGRIETIEVIEDAVQDADDVVSGYLLGQTLKYLLRMWHKGNSLQDAGKASCQKLRRLKHHKRQRQLRRIFPSRDRQLTRILGALP